MGKRYTDKRQPLPCLHTRVRPPSALLVQARESLQAAENAAPPLSLFTSAPASISHLENLATKGSSITTSSKGASVSSGAGLEPPPLVALPPFLPSPAGGEALELTLLLNNDACGEERKKVAPVTLETAEES